MYFSLAFFGPDLTAIHEKEFDPVFMKTLFEYGYNQARHGRDWKNFPPGYAE